MRDVITRQNAALWCATASIVREAVWWPRSITVLDRSARCNRDAKRVGLLTSSLNLRPAQDPNTRAGLVHLRPCTRASIP